MKVGVDASVLSTPFTGVGNYTFCLLEKLITANPDWEFVLYSNRALVSYPEAQNVTVCVETKGWRHTGGRQLWMNVKLPRHVKHDDIDVLWAPGGYLPLVPLVCPTVLTVYDFVVRRYPMTMKVTSRFLRYLVEGPSIRSASLTHTISDAVADELEHFYGRQTDGVIKPAADGRFHRVSDQEVQEVKSRYGLPDSFFIVVGTIEPRKNLECFFRAVAQLTDERPEYIPDMRIAVVGGRGWQDKAIWEQIQRLQDRGVVQLLGYVPADDMPRLYSAAKALCMPSVYEGFGMPVLEARMCGCPVVCSEVPAMREAGGPASTYHEPTSTGIRSVLKGILDGEIQLTSDRGADVNWSWEQGAQTLAGLLAEARGR